MKKMFVLGIVALAIGMGFTSCDDFGTGGTIKLVNDTNVVHSFQIYFGSVLQRVNDGQTSMQPGDKSVKAVSNGDTSYVVYVDGVVAKNGELTGGQTVEIKFSTLR